MVCKIDYNFHTHTCLCHHATGSMREYVEAAIAAGITELGFSDHAPRRAEHGNHETAWGRQPLYCVFAEDVPEYLATARALREEFADRITIHIGYETEYFPGSFPERLAELKAFGAEYLILGNHFIHEQNGQEFYVYGDHDRWDLLPLYVDAVIEAMRTGAFTYVAHPDLFTYTGDEALYTKQMRRLCEASLATGVPLEINLLGIREGRSYPSDRFFRIAGEVGAPVTFGMDAHSPDVVADFDSVPLASAIVEKHHLNYIGKPKLILL